MHGQNTRESDLKTLATLAAAALVFFFIFNRTFLAVSAFALLLIGLFFEKTAAAVSAAWLKFSLVLGNFNTRLLLGLIYYLLLTPLALTFRLFNRGTLGLPRGSGPKTSFHVRDHLFIPADLEKTW